jgi:AcrR family transcriptional regulator
MHVPVEDWDDDACLQWLWREQYSADGSRATCEACGRERRFHRLRDRRAFACDSCGHQIYPTAGTIFERSRTPLGTWFRAVLLLLGPEPPDPQRLNETLAIRPAASRRMRAKLFAALAEPGDQSELIIRLHSTLATGVPLDKAPMTPAAPPNSREASVDRIRAAACRTFAENGVDGTRIVDIAEEAGVSTGIIHYYFKHKDDVLLAALRWANEQIEETLSRLPDSDAHSVERIALMLDLSVPYEGLLRDEMLLWLEVWVRARQHPMLVSESYAISQTWHRQMTDAIQRGAEHGALRPVAAPDEVAHRLIAAANGLGFKVAVGHGGMLPREVRRLLHRLAAEQLDVPFAAFQQAAKVARKNGAVPAPQEAALTPYG